MATDPSTRRAATVSHPSTSCLTTDPAGVIRALNRIGDVSEGIELLQLWVADLEPADVAEIRVAVEAMEHEYTTYHVSDVPPNLPHEDVSDHWPFRQEFGNTDLAWGFRLLAFRYGYPAALCWLHAPDDVIAERIQRTRSAEPSVHTDRDTLARLLAHEERVRRAEREYRFAEARRLLDSLPAGAPDAAARLVDEYKHLLAASVTDLNDPHSSTAQLLRLHVRVKELAAPIPWRSTPAPVAEIIEDDDGGDLPPAPAPTRHAAPAPSPVFVGATLEDATLTTFRRLFELSRAQADAVVNVLRRQRSGFQFGHDVSFDATVAGTFGVRCHVECKNYAGTVATGHIADKLLQQKAAAATAPIDHWILISPHADPGNDLQELLGMWADTDEWGFSVQVWSPQSGIRELFALAPDAYRKLYGEDPPPVDPDAVVRTFLDRLQPYPRIPAPFRRYLRDSWRMCFRTEDSDHFTMLLDDHVDIGTVDATGRPSDRRLLDIVQEWLEDKAAVPNMLLLGEFGDGKSFFTYTLSRLLADQFVAGAEHAIFPVRLALKDLRQAGSAGLLLERWLGAVGATPADWADLTAQHRTLVILDGFDEMSTQLDPSTIAENFALLTDALDVLSSPSTTHNRGSKVLVTSRGRFFDQPREEAALRERLHQPLLHRIRPLSRTDVLTNLTHHAERVGARDKLARLRTLYDPIGLAAKPLFLQMIKETLQKLPDDEFTAITLYETYIEESLRRKSDLLRSGEPYELATDIVARLREVLEQVAVRIHVDAARTDPSDGRPTDETDLRSAVTDTALAEMLWQMTRPPVEAEHDARLRVAIRSLLRPIPDDDPDAWRVSFFHRSVMEYFLAAAIVRALHADDQAALRRILEASTLSPDILDFVAQRFGPGTDRDVKPLLSLAKSARRSPLSPRRSTRRPRLLSLARSAQRSQQPATALGGNAVSLAYLICGHLPEGDWRDLQLDNARLPGIDLRGRDLSGSSLRNALLDNADLRDANLEDTDLTGLRVERTTQVTTVAIDTDGAAILVGYSDGTVREWTRTQAHWSAKTVVADLPHAAVALVTLTASTAIVVTAQDVQVMARTRPEWTVTSRSPRSPFLANFDIVDGDIISVSVTTQPLIGRWNPTTDEASLFAMPAEAPVVHAMFPLMEQPHRTSRDADISGVWMMSTFFVGKYLGPRLWHLPTGRVWNLPPAPYTAFTVVSRAEGYTLFAGDANGSILEVELPGDEDLPIEGSAVPLHDGPVSCVAAAGVDMVVTGGDDRSVRVWPSDGQREKPIALLLTLRCAGVRLDRAEGAAERQMLTELARLDSR